MARRNTNRGSRGLLGGVAWDPQALYRDVKQCGGHFFDKDTRRFFNSRVTRTYPVSSKKMTYFVESFGGGRTPVGKMYRVGVFKNCKVTKLGAGIYGKTYKTSAAANRVAERMAYSHKRKNARRRKAAK